MKAQSKHFKPIIINNHNQCTEQLTTAECSDLAVENRQHFFNGIQVLFGIPFELGDKDQNNMMLIDKQSKALEFESFKCRQIVFLHTADINCNLDADASPYPFIPLMGQEVCKYNIKYASGRMIEQPIRRRYEVNEISIGWGERAFLSLPAHKARPITPNTDLLNIGKHINKPWGKSQTQVEAPGEDMIMQQYLYAFENPYPDDEIVGIDIIPTNGRLFLFGMSITDIVTHPLRWEGRQKALVTLPKGTKCDDLQIDMGNIISVQSQTVYNHLTWENDYNIKPPVLDDNKVLIEYTAHKNACLHFGSESIPISEIENTCSHDSVISIKPAQRPVKIIVTEKNSGKKTPVRIHVHGEHGEYLAPMNRHRIPNRNWFEDYSPEFVHNNHFSTYIDGMGEFLLPLSKVYVEVSKGLEIRPVRMVFDIDADTSEIKIELEKVLKWREKGWITADTHVHFLSPQTAMLEGQGEGINVVNLLASQWGELFTNVGDFDNKTLTADDFSGDNDYMVRVGTENRQHVLGHISLLGYEGNMILPLTTGGPDESALGDPIAGTLTKWARRCREQKGVVILPHFPEPRAEGAAAIVLDTIDGVEMTSWGNAYGGLSPFSISDWYRYLNLGYQVPAVGGTDKMSADTAVGLVRTYTKLSDDIVSYDAWKDAVKSGNTFVTYGPLIDFSVQGKQAGETINLPKGGGTLDVSFTAASVTVPITGVELISNGEIVAQKQFDNVVNTCVGSFSVRIVDSSWLALRVKGKMPDREESIMAHSSTIMVLVDNKKCFKVADAMSVLNQIEGVKAYVNTIGTRAEEQTFKEVMMTLTSAHRELHNRMHNAGLYHDHSVMDNHHDE